MSTTAKDFWISPDAYLTGENDAAIERRHEYVNGQVFAMVGASRAHNLIAMNLAALLHRHLQGSACQVFQSDMKVRIKSKKDIRFYYPDIQVSCASEPENYFNDSPCLVVEVLSPHTERTDRTEKLEGYKLIDSLQEYVLLSQDAVYAEVYRRTEGWRRTALVSGETLSLSSLGLDLSLDVIFQGVW